MGKRYRVYKWDRLKRDWESGGYKNLSAFARAHGIVPRIVYYAHDRYWYPKTEAPGDGKLTPEMKRRAAAYMEEIERSKMEEAEVRRQKNIDLSIKYPGKRSGGHDR